ncbi:acyl-[acyl-carrier-protein] thioesterase, partial [Enterococcus lactis]
NEEIISPFECEKIKKIKRQEKIETIHSGVMLPYPVSFYDIDSNQHVIYAMYFNWNIDVLGYDFLTTHVGVKVIIRFVKELVYGYEIERDFVLV